MVRSLQKTHAGFALLASLSVLAAAPAFAQPHTGADLSRGRLLTQRYCAGCHAIARSGTSPNPAAPPFRDLHERYQVDDLAEALAEGILVGHVAMPEMRFPPADVKAILAYIKSVQSDLRANAEPTRRSAARPLAVDGL